MQHWAACWYKGRGGRKQVLRNLQHSNRLGRRGGRTQGSSNEPFMQQRSALRALRSPQLGVVPAVVCSFINSVARSLTLPPQLAPPPPGLGTEPVGQSPLRRQRQRQQRRVKRETRGPRGVGEGAEAAAGRNAGSPPPRTMDAQCPNAPHTAHPHSARYAAHAPHCPSTHTAHPPGPGSTVIDWILPPSTRTYIACGVVLRRRVTGAAERWAAAHAAGTRACP